MSWALKAGLFSLVFTDLLQNQKNINNISVFFEAKIF